MKLSVNPRDAALIRHYSPIKFMLISGLKALPPSKKKTVYLFSKDSLRNVAGKRSYFTFFKSMLTVYPLHPPGKPLK